MGAILYTFHVNWIGSVCVLDTENGIIVILEILSKNTASVVAVEIPRRQDLSGSQHFAACSM